jgi:hypothetical protein
VAGVLRGLPRAGAGEVGAGSDGGIAGDDRAGGRAAEILADRSGGAGFYPGVPGPAGAWIVFARRAIGGKKHVDGVADAVVFDGLERGPGKRIRSGLPNLWRWVDYPAFTMEVQDAFKNGSGERSAWGLLKALAQAPLLIIDDIGVEKNTPYVVQATYYLLDQREKWMRPTFITTNVPLAELDDQYGARITDRIAGMCAVREVKGKNWRLDK